MCMPGSAPLGSRASPRAACQASSRKGKPTTATKKPTVPHTRTSPKACGPASRASASVTETFIGSSAVEKKASPAVARASAPKPRGRASTA